MPALRGFACVRGVMSKRATGSGETDWWKICEHPVVQGLHRVFTLIGAPLVVIALVGVWHSFDQMRQDVTRLSVLVDVSLGKMDARQNRFDMRIQQVERGLGRGGN